MRGSKGLEKAPRHLPTRSHRLSTKPSRQASRRVVRLPMVSSTYSIDATTMSLSDKMLSVHSDRACQIFHLEAHGKDQAVDNGWPL